MCAMYAFMRRADDISDDESIPLADRRLLMQRWHEAFQTSQAFDLQDVPIFLAVRDVQLRYKIDDSLLDELIQGTAMDLSPSPPEGVLRTTLSGRQIDLYQTVGALETYCYLVASVVGLVTIRIFGFTDPRADEYAIHLGKAFQFTNILRDVKEDAQRGRIYLPDTLLRQHGATPEEVLQASEDTSDIVSNRVSNRVPITPALRATMQDLGARADAFYRAGDALVPLLDRDSRGAMLVLIRIYASLLHVIQSASYDVFSRRRRVSTPRKLLILLRGMWSSILHRTSRA